MSQKAYSLKSKSCLKRLRSFQDVGSDKDQGVSPVENNNGRDIVFGNNNNTHTSNKRKDESHNMINEMENEDIYTSTPKRLRNGIGFTSETEYLRIETKFSNKRTAAKQSCQAPYRLQSRPTIEHITTRGDDEPNIDAAEDRDIKKANPTRLNAINNNTFEPMDPSPAINPNMSDDIDLDIDVINVQDVKQATVNFINQNIPVQMKSPFPKETSLLRHVLFPSAKQPEAVDEIFIPHQLQTDNVCGDRFGANLATYSARDNQNKHSPCNQHIFYNVTRNGPASQMRIEDGDELVLINDEFVPHLSHTDVLNLFHKVKVDSKTRLRLVIRRIKPKNSIKKKQWAWFEISAILVPEGKEPYTKQGSVIKDPYYRPLENNRYELKSTFRFNVQGTQLYMDINSTGIRVRVLDDTATDDTKNIIQWARYQENPKTSKAEFIACLCGNDRRSYVAVDMTNTAVVSTRPTWFQYRLIGSSILLSLEDTCSYLGCDRTSGTLMTQPEEIYFKRVPLPHEQDCPDICVQSATNEMDDCFGNDDSEYNEALNQNYTTATQSNIGNNDGGVSEPMGDEERLNIRPRITRSMSRQMSATRRDLCFLEI